MLGGGRLDYDATKVRRFGTKMRALIEDYRLRASMKQRNKKPSKKKSQSYTTEDPTKWAVAVALPQEPMNSCNHFKLGDAVALTTCEFIGDGVVEYFIKYFAATFGQGRVHVCTFMHMMFFIDVQTGMLLKKSDRRKKQYGFRAIPKNFFNKDGARLFVPVNYPRNLHWIAAIVYRLRSQDTPKCRMFAIEIRNDAKRSTTEQMQETRATNEHVAKCRAKMIQEVGHARHCNTRASESFACASFITPPPLRRLPGYVFACGVLGIAVEIFSTDCTLRPPPTQRLRVTHHRTSGAVVRE